MISKIRKQGSKAVAVVVGVSVVNYGTAVYLDPADPKVPQPHPAGVVFMTSASTDTGVESIYVFNTYEGPDLKIEAPASYSVNAPFLRHPDTGS